MCGKALPHSVGCRFVQLAMPCCAGFRFCEVPFIIALTACAVVLADGLEVPVSPGPCTLPLHQAHAFCFMLRCVIHLELSFVRVIGHLGLVGDIV